MPCARAHVNQGVAILSVSRENTLSITRGFAVSFDILDDVLSISPPSNAKSYTSLRVWFLPFSLLNLLLFCRLVIRVVEQVLERLSAGESSTPDTVNRRSRKSDFW
jgi:hypothetical protein